MLFVQMYELHLLLLLGGGEVEGRNSKGGGFPAAASYNFNHLSWGTFLQLSAF